MSILIGRARLPMVTLAMVTVGAFTVLRLRGVFGLCMSVSDSGTADLRIQLRPKRVICEVYGSAARVLPELCGAGQSRREMPATGALLIA
jgi:Mycobacterium membrane protein